MLVEIFCFKQLVKNGMGSAGSTQKNMGAINKGYLLKIFHLNQIL